VAPEEAWKQAERQRRRRLLMAVLLTCLLVLLSAFVAAARWELFARPVVVGPTGERVMVANYASPLDQEPSCVLSWEQEDGTWSLPERLPGRYLATCFFQGDLHVFFEDGSYSRYHQGLHVERDLFPFDWTPVQAAVTDEAILAFGGQGTTVLRSAERRGERWEEGPQLSAGHRTVTNMRAVPYKHGAMVVWQQETGENGRSGLFFAPYSSGAWGAAQVLTLSEVRNFALDNAAGDELLLLAVELAPGKQRQRLFWQRAYRDGRWTPLLPVSVSQPTLSGRILDFSLSHDATGPMLVVSRAGNVEAYRQKGQAWEPGELLVTSGLPAGLSGGSWLVVTVAALVTLVLATAFYFSRSRVSAQAALHVEISYASLADRGVALGFDLVLVFFLVMAFAGDMDLEHLGLTATSVHMGYAALAEAYWGMTLGKKLVGIVVVTPQLEGIGFVRSGVRNLLRFADGLGMYVVGVIAVALSRRRQRLGDRLAGTVVLRESALLVPRASTVRDGGMPSEGELES